jgi:hypothetical protein
VIAQFALRPLSVEIDVHPRRSAGGVPSVYRRASPPLQLGLYRIGVEEPIVTTADLLAAWREATRAAELAERLAKMADEAAQEADESAIASEALAALAEQAADAAATAARTARATAERARARASDRTKGAASARDDEGFARAGEEAARVEYHQVEDDARRRYGGEDEGDGAPTVESS